MSSAKWWPFSLGLNVLRVEVCSCILLWKLLAFYHSFITHVLMEMYCLCHRCVYGNFLLFITRDNVFRGINNLKISSKLNCLFILPCITKIYTGKALNRGPFQKRLRALNLRNLRFSTVNKIHIFQGMVRYFVWNFKGYLRNSTQNILPIHWKIRFLYSAGILRTLKFKSSYMFLKRHPGPIQDGTSGYTMLHVAECYKVTHCLDTVSSQIIDTL